MTAKFNILLLVLATLAVSQRQRSTTATACHNLRDTVTVIGHIQGESTVAHILFRYIASVSITQRKPAAFLLLRWRR
jgi:hypothetical protein